MSAGGLLTSARAGNRIRFAANPEDRILESIVQRLGRLELALLVGDYALGRDSGLIDLVLVGAIDQRNLADLVAKTERHLARKIRPLVLTAEEYTALATTLTAQPHLVLWTAKADGADRRPGASPANATQSSALNHHAATP